MSDRVEQYYDSIAMHEWGRLERHRTEYAVTMRVLHQHLPPGSRILDVGGGPGRYAIALTEAGHRVTLLDLAQANLALARQKAAEAGVALEGLVHGNALDLTAFADASFDAVLLMGPLYHLLEESQRTRCLQEAIRVLRPGGLLMASVIVRYSLIRNVARFEPERVLQIRDLMSAMLETGVCRVPEDSHFTDFYGFRPGDLAPWMESFGLTTREVVGQEGLVSEIEEKVNELTGEAFAAWVEINLEAGRDPSLWGQAQHLLYVGTRPA